MNRDLKSKNDSNNEELIEFFSKRFEIIKKQRQTDLEEERQKYKSATKILEKVKKNPV